MYNSTHHVIARAGFALSWATGTFDFRDIFLPNTGEDKKSHYERGAPGTVPYVKYVHDNCVTFMKKLQEGLS